MITVPNTDFTAKSNPMSISIKPHNNEYMILVDTVEIIKKESITEQENDITESNESETSITDYIPQLYVGSLTVLGLYILYRLLNKK